MKLTFQTGTGLLLAAAALSAQAANATITTRESKTRVDWFGGFANVIDTGSQGDTETLYALDPATRRVADTHPFDGAYLYWTFSYTMHWDVQQTWSLDTAASSFSGSGSRHFDNTGEVVGLNCPPCQPTMQVSGTNLQALQFTLDAPNAYSIHSVATMGQWTELQRWDDVGARWSPLWVGAVESQGKTFDRSGTLQAGLYRVANSPYSARSDGGRLFYDDAWSWTLTLPGATVAAVPEPGGGLLLAAGMALLAWRRSGERLRRP